jgi:NAD(P)-dependent dehydrogenase (short-subunit alcohol dehydrogenase family)
LIINAQNAVSRIKQEGRKEKMSKKLKGKVAVVTGSGAGIGEAVARLYAEEGCRVVVADRQRNAAERVAKDIGGLAVPTDVADEAQVAALFNSCDEAHGRLDIVVNNAGVPGPTVSVENEDMAAWDETMAVNVRGVILCIKHAVPLMKRHGGAIVNLSSGSGLKGGPLRNAYCASKFAVIGITQSVAFEVGIHGIRCNAICPGAVAGTGLIEVIVGDLARTEGRSVDEYFEKNFVRSSALRKKIETRDIAEVALFLASDAAGAITGEHLQVNAGR